VTDAEVLADVEAEFAVFPRPEHFTDFRHCSECAEHDELLRSRNRGQLRPEDVSNPGWDPICFVSNEAFLYLVPDLVRVALLPVRRDIDWSFPTFLFHLTDEGERNRRLSVFSSKHRASIVRFLRHVAATRQAELANSFPCDEIGPAIALWDRVA
jgi:hypothetical protein